MPSSDNSRSDNHGTAGLLKRIAYGVRMTPLHPQWFAFFREQRNLRQTCRVLSGIVLDVGCAEGKPRRFMPASAEYVGLDNYTTAREWYGTRPDIYGDARALPLADASVDHCLLLDVLEHISDPEHCLAEMCRALKPGGSLTIQVPFLYPLHDSPLDFHRWTRFGLRRAAEKHGFRISSERAIGHPLETAALNGNIALSQTVLNWARQRNPLVLLGALLPVFVPLINVLAWGFAVLGRKDDLMPYAYRMVWIKQ